MSERNMPLVYGSPPRDDLGLLPPIRIVRMAKGRIDLFCFFFRSVRFDSFCRFFMNSHIVCVIDSLFTFWMAYGECARIQFCHPVYWLWSSICRVRFSSRSLNANTQCAKQIVITQSIREFDSIRPMAKLVIGWRPSGLFIERLKRLCECNISDVAISLVDAMRLDGEAISNPGRLPFQVNNPKVIPTTGDLRKRRYHCFELISWKNKKVMQPEMRQVTIRQKANKYHWLGNILWSFIKFITIVLKVIIYSAISVQLSWFIRFRILANSSKGVENISRKIYRNLPWRSPRRNPLLW